MTDDYPKRCVECDQAVKPGGFQYEGACAVCLSCIDAGKWRESLVEQADAVARRRATGKASEP